MGQAGDVAAGKVAAGQIRGERMELLGDVRTQAEQQVKLGYAGAELGYDVSMSQYRGGARDVEMGSQIGMRNIQAGGNIAMAQSGLATSGTIQQKVGMQTGDLMAKYKSDMTKLFETRDFAGKEKDLAKKQMGISKEEADLAFRRGEISAEDAYQTTLTGLESVPTTFMEGLFG